MADIFISYSSKNRAQTAGLSVWIDKSGINVVTSWSGEIVDAIDGCRSLIVMLSP